MGAWDEARALSAPEHGWAEDVYLGGADPLSTGTILDQALGGGLMPGVTVLGGVASAGKSTLACNIAEQVVLSGKRVLYLTLDDSWGNVMSRILAAYSVDMHATYGAGSFTWSELPESRKRWARLSQEDRSRAAYEGWDAPLMAARSWEERYAPLLAVVDSVTSVGEIAKMLGRMAEGGELPALVVVDYVQQYQTGDHDTDSAEYSRVSEVATQLQRMAFAHRLPILALSSLRKLSKSDDDPTLDWFRGSGVVGYSAWAACVITRVSQGSDSQRMRLHVVKNKAGKAGTTTDYDLWGAYGIVRPVKEASA